MVFTQKFTGNFVIQVLGKFLAVLVGLIALAITARVLGPYQFGEYMTAITFLQLFGVLVDFGLTLTLLVMMSEPGANEGQVVNNLLTFRLVTSTVLFALSILLSWLFPWSEAVKLGVAAGAIGYATMAGAALLVGVFQKHQVVWRASLAEFINRLVLLLGIGFFAVFSPSPLTMILALTIANVVWLLVMIWLCRPFVHIRPAFDVSVWKTAMKKGWPIAISILFNLIYLKGDTFLLSLFRSPEEVGLYGAAYRVIDVLTVVPAIFMGLLLPALVSDWASHNKEEFGRHIRRSFDTFLLLVIPVVAGVQALGYPIIVFIAGKEFAGSGHILQLLIWAMLGVFLSTLFGHVVVAINKQKPMILGYLFTAIVGIGGYLLFIPKGGMEAAAWMTILTESLMALLTFFMVWKTTRILPGLLTTIKATAASLLMYSVIVALPEWHVLILIALGGLVYLGVMLLLGGIKLSTLLELMPNRLASHMKRS